MSIAVAVYVFIGCIGLCVGSFINLLTVRLALGEPVMTARSHCPHCHHELRAADLIPVVSFVLLGRRCHYCRAPISWRYPVVELLTAFLFAAILYKYRISFTASGSFMWVLSFIRDLAFTGGLLTLFILDYSWYIVPDVVSLPLIALGVVSNVALGVSVRSLVTGMALGGSLYFALWFFSRGKWVGSGDIRLGLVLGAMLGFPGTLAALEVAYLVGGVVAVALLATHRKQLADRLPMGAFLTVGAWVSILFNTAINRWLSIR